MQKLVLEKGEGLVIVAHPDDETIWIGGVLLTFPNVRWTIFSLCRGDDKDRAPKFKRACGLYGAKHIISDLEDEGVLDIKESVPEIVKRIQKFLPHRHFSYLFTHGRDGEYGHARHRGVHRAVKKVLLQEDLTADSTFYFSYHLGHKRGIAVPKRDAQYVLRLKEKIFKSKRDIIKKIYGFRSSSFEYQSSAREETFTLKAEI